MFLRWKTVSAIINRKKLTSHQCRLLNVAENLERKDLNIWEEACALKHLYPTGTEITVAAMAAELKKPKAWILVRRRLLTMPEKIQKQAASGLLSQANLQDLFKMDSEEQLFAAEAIADARSKSGGHKHLRGLDSKYRSRRTAHRRPKINTMIEELFGLGVLGFPLRVAAWCAAQISDDELKDDAKQYVQKFKEQI
jgi:ParB-like chromosome segregation protein Spo0J